jgi:hypothetical protein
MRKRISKPKFKDMFNLVHKYNKVDSYIHYNIQNYNSLFGIFLFILVGFSLSFINIKLLVFPISLSVYLGYEYIRLSIAVKNLTIKRHVAKHVCIEGDKLLVEYRVNDKLSRFKFSIVDEFGGSSQKKIQSSGSTKKINHSFHLDNGFGEFYFNELKVTLSDHLELFTFTVTFIKKDRILVEPYVQRIKNFSHQPLFDSKSIGEYEFIKKGYSPTFYGLREYRFGDALKYINWKASEKYKKVVVNEYENIQSLNTCIWLELSIKDHMGDGVNSTWEYTRDLSLSLVKNSLEKNHSIEFYTNTFNADENLGDVFKELKIRLSKERYEHKREHKYSFYDSLVKYEQGSDLYLVQPLYISDNLIKNIDFLIKNSSYFGNKKLFLIDGYQAVKDLDPGEFLSRVQIEQKNANDYLKEHSKVLSIAEIEVYVITVKSPHLIREQIERVV